MHVVGHGSGVGYRIEALSNHQSTDRRRCIPTGVLVPGPASNEETVRDEIADTSREPRDSRRVWTMGIGSASTLPPTGLLFTVLRTGLVLRTCVGGTLRATGSVG